MYPPRVEIACYVNAQFIPITYFLTTYGFTAELHNFVYNTFFVYNLFFFVYYMFLLHVLFQIAQDFGFEQICSSKDLFLIFFRVNLLLLWWAQNYSRLGTDYRVVCAYPRK